MINADDLKIGLFVTIHSTKPSDSVFIFQKNVLLKGMPLLITDICLPFISVNFIIQPALDIRKEILDIREINLMEIPIRFVEKSGYSLLLE